MTLAIHDFFEQYAATGDVPVMLVDGEDIIAHVHESRYLEVFLQAPAMLAFIRKMSEFPCQRGCDGTHSPQCPACEARLLLQRLILPV